jgi:hypothetical protein
MAVTRENNVEFVDETERALFAEAILGEDIRKFLSTDPVGQYLHHRAKLEIQRAQIDALEVDPDGFSWLRSRAKLRKIRARADAARMLMAWLSEAIINGDSAATQLEEYRTK